MNAGAIGNTIRLQSEEVIAADNSIADESVHLRTILQRYQESLVEARESISREIENGQSRLQIAEAADSFLSLFKPLVI